jgi:hypothetical protein
VLDHDVVNVENNFLQKPFTLKQLSGKIRTVLDRSHTTVPSIAAGAIEHSYSATAGSGSAFHPSIGNDRLAT